MLTFLYRIYQVFILLPVVVIDTIIIGGTIMLLAPFGGDRWHGVVGSRLGRIWGWVIVRATLLPVRVEGREKLREGQSYVIVANHLSCYDIFLIFGFLGLKIRWMMKASLMRIPFLGGASRVSGFIPVDTSSPSKVHETYLLALKEINSGVSLVVFPEGRRSPDGKLGKFRRGAFMIADKLQLPVVPVTLKGTYEVMPRQRDFHFAHWHPLTMVIHDPVECKEQGAENLEHLMKECRKAISEE